MAEGSKEKLGDYELLELIGDGAQGKVFKSRRCGAAPDDESAIFAIKVLRFSGEDERKVSRFKQSAETLRGLEHPAIVRYHDVYTWHSGDWDEAHCLVMEYLAGDSLQDLLKRNPAGLPWPEVWRIFSACLDALIYARSKGIIHRDIKPSNIFIRKDGAVKLIDFDIARREDESQNSTAGWKGTFDYMAPDFVTVPNFRGDEQSDIFSLGTCLYQSITGKLPFPPLGEGAHIGYLNRWRDPASSQPNLDAGVLRVLANVKPLLAKSMHGMRDQRYATFQDMRADLERVHYRTLEHRGKDTYELTDWMGRGGCGEVYKGRRMSDNTAVAVKRLLVPALSDRFIKEARILEKYAHEALVKYIDFMEVIVPGGEKHYLIVLELLEGMPGSTLADRLHGNRRVPPREGVQMFIRYLSALQFLHEHARPIIHRDIKPSNLYAPAGAPDRAKIMDLGVARDVVGTATSGGIPGTLNYMAPEFATLGNERGSPQSDIFSIGLCLHEAMTGQPLFEKLPNNMSTAWLKFQERFHTTYEIDKDHPVWKRYPALCRIVEKALQKDPRQRYTSAALMKKDLEAALPLVQEAADAQDDVEAPTFATAPGVATRRLVREEPGLPAIPDLPDSSPDIAKAKPGEEPAPARSGGKGPALALVFATILLLGGSLAGFLWWQAQQKEQEADLQTPSPGVTPAVETDEPAGTLALSPILAQPAANRAYVDALAAEIQRLREGTSNGTLRGAAPRQALGRLEQQAMSLPGLFDSAIKASGDDLPGLQKLQDAWSVAAGQVDLLGLTLAEKDAVEGAIRHAMARASLAQTVQGLLAGLPASIGNAETLASAEKIATDLAGLHGQAMPDLPADERDAQLARVRDLLLPLLATRLEQLDKAGELEAVKAAAPNLAALQPEAFAARGKLLADQDQGRADFAAAVQSLQKMLPDAAENAEQLDRFEEVAAKLKDFPAQTWLGIGDAEQSAEAARLRERMLPALGAAVANRRAEALALIKYDSQLEGVQDPLLNLRDDYPSASALVAGTLAKALQDVEKAWRARPTSPPPAPEAKPVAETRPVAAPKAVDPNEAAALKALADGAATYLPTGQPGFDANRFNDVLTAAQPVHRGLRVLDLQMSAKPSQDFIAASGEFWANITAFPGPFAPAVQETGWKVIYNELLAASLATLKGEIARRTPLQQARIRREFIKVLGLVDDITGGRIAQLPPQDVLRARVGLYFEDGFFNASLLDPATGGARESVELKVPWIKEEFDKARSKHGIHAAGP